MENNQHRRRSIRLPAYDYAQPGAYFVTLVTHQRKFLFGRIEGEVMQLNAFGRVVANCWQEIPAHFPSVSTAIFVVMPNHFHGIIEIRDEFGAGEGAGAAYMPPQTDQELIRDKPISLGTIIGTFKAAVSRKIHQLPGCGDIKIWQRNYYEHVIRDQGEYERVVNYIHANPASWAADRENRK